jgi:hypothetical protein
MLVRGDWRKHWLYPERSDISDAEANHLHEREKSDIREKAGGGR